MATVNIFLLSLSRAEDSLSPPPIEVFHTFPALKELDLAFNGIKTVYVKNGDFKFLEVSWR